MAEESRAPDNTAAEEDIRTEGDEGARNAQVTPTIADDAEQGQTQVPAPEDDATEAEGTTEEAQDPHP